uniref:NusG antitermination factor (NusG) n=1 Tax=uncultured marine group II/III euryarchaeote AD1000_66_E09 TaxID=1457798 RepID=A0A075G0X6_9EURY|nr:NusG antitermination factor (nusG) [uncultured marine group II/III euryarchaeote AD1000_66_E09]
MDFENLEKEKRSSAGSEPNEGNVGKDEENNVPETDKHETAIKETEEQITDVSETPSALSEKQTSEFVDPEEIGNVNPFTDMNETETTAQVSAAEQEYQDAMKAVRALGLDQDPGPSSVDEEADAAERLVEQLGLTSPDTKSEETPIAPEVGSETAVAERTRRQNEERVRQQEEEAILGPKIKDGREWYVINTYSGHENRVKANLTRRIASMDVAERIFRVEVPTEEELEIRGGQRRQVQRKLLPGYVLAEMILDDDTWYVVRNTPGVTGFVGSEKPHALPRAEVLGILKQMRQEAPRVRVGFETGDTVRVREGPFEDFMGQVNEINLDKGKVRVMISMFGRDTPVEVDLMQVEKA